MYTNNMEKDTEKHFYSALDFIQTLAELKAAKSTEQNHKAEIITIHWRYNIQHIVPMNEFEMKRRW